MSSSTCTLTTQQREKEHAVFWAIVLDSLLLIFLATVGLLSGSMTALSEIIRCVLLLIIEYVSYAVLRRAHRDKFNDFEFGTGKIERITNLLVAFGLLLSSLYIFSRIISMSDSTPLSTNSLMLTMVGANINLILNYYFFVTLRKGSQP